MIRELLPGLNLIEVPLPGSPLKSVNSYVLTGGSRKLVIDTGMRRSECEAAIRGGFDELDLDLASTDFFITHLHADHIGLVTDLAARGSTVYFNRPDGQLLATWVEGAETSFDRLVDEALRAGFSRAEVEEALELHPGFKYSPPHYPPFHFLEDGDCIEAGPFRLEVVATPGHTPGHLCLYEPTRKLLFSGDHVLGDITPNITVWRDDDDSLGDYLKSLDRVAQLDVDLVLPGHRRVVGDLSGRIAELQRHHRSRLDEVLEVLDNRRASPYDVASQMTWDIAADSWAEFPVVQKWFAVSEATSHLRYLERRGAISVSTRSGVIRFAKR